MTHVASPVSRRRLLLIMTSALGGIAALPAIAQTVPVIPTGASVDSVQSGFGLNPQITNPNGDLNVRLRADNTVIDWKGFNIPENRTANFENGTLFSNVAVLNRDISGNVSQLLGKLTSSPGVAVWVFNSNGIMVGPGANLMTGSLVLSTLDVNTADFLNGSGNYRLSTGVDAGGSTSAITVMKGAQITVEGGNRGLIMVAPQVDADGVFQAMGQDIAFVTATDVTLNYSTNSPLSVTLNRGTVVPGRSQYIRGTVSGRDALFALASQGTVTDALLQVDAGVTTASNGRRGIILSAGKPGTAVAGVGVGGAAAATGGIASVLTTGVLSTEADDGGDIIVGASGAASFTNALTSGRDVVLSAGGALLVRNGVTADRDYKLAAQGIALGGGPPAIQRAGRDVSLVSTNGNISGAPALSLRSGGSAGLTLSTVGTAAGDILFDVTTSLVGGSDRGGYVDIRQRDAINQVALGNVTARGLRQAIGTGAIRNGLTTIGALTLGNVDVRDALALNVGGLGAGTLASDRGVSIASNGAIATRAITARGGSLDLTGTGTTLVDGTITASGSNFADLVVARDGAVTLQGLTAARDVEIGGGSGTVTIAGAVDAGRNYQVSGSAVTLGGAGTVIQRAAGAVTITADAGGITGLEGLTLRSDANGSGNDPLTLALTASSPIGITFSSDSSLIAGTSRQSDVRIELTDSANPILLGRVEARSLTGLNTTSSLRLGDVSTVNNLTATGASIAAGALTASSGAVTLTATAGTLTTGAIDAAQGISLTGSDAIATGRLTAGGAVTVNAVGAATFGSDVTAGGALTLRGASLGFTGGSVRSGGSIDLLASSGGIIGTGAVALASTSTRTSDFVRLQATGVEGIVLAPGSAITAGANRTLRVGVFNAAADAPLRLGNVSARSLSALGAANADATVLGGAIVSGDSLSFGALDLVDGFAAESTSGNISVGRLAVTGAGQGISLRAANGTLIVQDDLSASGDVTLASGSALQLGTVESRDGQALLTSGRSVTLSTLAGRLGVSASGTRIAIDTVRGGDVALTANGGDVRVGRIDGAAVSVTATGSDVTIRDALAATGAVSLIAAGDVRVGGALTGAGVTVGAQGDTALLGGLQARGDVALTGRSITLGGAHSATGAYTATSSAGAITGNAGTAIVADSDNRGGEALSLSATGGGIVFDPATSLRGGNGTSAVALVTDGGIISVGDVAATVFTATGAGSIRTGDLALSKSLALSASAGVTTGAIATGDGAVTIDSSSGAVSTGAINAGGGVTLAGDTVAFGTVRAASLGATAKVGSLTGGDITVDGVTTLQAAGDLNIGAVRAGNSVSLGGGTMRFGRIEASALTATSGGTLDGGDIVTRGDATLTAGGALAAGAVDADGIVGLSGTSVTVGRIDGASLTAIASTGALVAGDMLIAGPARIEATGGTVDLGTVDTRGDLTIAAGGRLFATGLVSGGAASIEATGAGSDVLLTNGLVAQNSVVVAATGNIRAPVISSTTGDLTIAAPNGDLTGLDGESGVSIGTGKGRAFSLTIGAKARLGDVSGGKLTVVATSISAGRIDTGDEALELRATAGDLTMTGPASGGTVSLGASGRTLLTGVTAKGALTLTGGSIAFSNIAGASIDATSAGAITGGSATAAGALGIRGGAVTLNQATAGAALALTATGGDLNVTGPATGGDVTLGASGLTNLGKVTATGALVLNGGRIGFADIAGASIDATSTGAVTGTSATATGALGIRGTALTLGQVAAGGAATLTATGGDLLLTGLTSGSDATLGATGSAQISGAVTTGGAYRVTGGSVTLGDTGIVQKAGGEVRITATSGDLTGMRGLTLVSDADGTGGTDRMVLDAAGQIGFAGTSIQARPGSGGLLGLRAGSGRTMQFGSIEAGRIGSFDGNAVGATLSHNASIGADDIAVSDVSVALERGDLTFGKVVASGNLALRTDAGAIALGDVSAGDVDLASSGALTTTAVTSSGATSLKGDTIDVRGTLAAARQLLADARATLTLRDVNAGGAATLKAGGAIVAGTVGAASITANGAGVTLANAKASDALALTSGRDLSLGSGSAGGTATLDVAGLATIGALSGGPAVTVTANDVALNGPVRAQTVAFTNRTPATTTMRIGDGTGADGFRLSDAEVRQVTADTLRFDAGAGGMEVGTLALGTGSGRTVEMLGTGDIRVIGAVSTQGSGRAVRIGGGVTDGNANAIHVIATSDGGGRLLFDGSDVELRGTRIAIGLAPGFIDSLQPGAAGLAQAQSLIGNGNSALYNPQLGGGVYDPAYTTTLSARSLTVRFGDYALFQNTAIPGEFSGLKLGGTPGAPVSPALRVSTFGTPGQASVALFGTINGIDGASAALLGSPVISIDPVLLASTRINGCLAGSGAGCINTIVIQPTLQVFDWNSEEVFGIARDVTVPFAPVVGSNNEELLTDLPALAPQSLTDQKGQP